VPDHELTRHGQASGATAADPAAERAQAGPGAATADEGGAEAGEGGAEASAGGAEASEGGAEAGEGGAEASEGGAEASGGGAEASGGGAEASAGGAEASAGGAESVADGAGADGAGAPASGPEGPGRESPGAPSGGRRSRSRSWRMPGFGVLWLSIFGGSLGLFILRFLVPVPVGQADNHDGPRLMCGLGVGPVTHGHPRWFRYAYFEYVPHTACAHIPFYPSSEIVPLGIARLLTPVLGLSGTLNLIALGLLYCVIAAFGIASLAAGLRVRAWAQLAVAAAAWLIVADAAFFDVYASPFSEPAALIGLLLVAAGVLYLGRGWQETAYGLALAGSGGFLAIMAKEQYLTLAVPVCLALVLACAPKLQGRWRGRFRTRQAAAGIVAAAVLAVMAAAYGVWDNTSSYGARLHHEQAVDMIFSDIVNKQATAAANLRALGLPVSWARYANHDFWNPHSVRHDPLYHRYAGKLTDITIAKFLLSHPGYLLSTGQHAAVLAQRFRVNTLGNYPPTAGHPPSATESRVAVLSWLMRQLPAGLGLGWLLPLWAAMAAAAIAALRRRRGSGWHRDGAVLVLCMTGCAIAAFLPPAYFAGISTTRHMAGMNIATAFAFVVSIALAVSLAHGGLSRVRHPRSGSAPEAGPVSLEPASADRAAASKR
jgi:hypothetical protein